MGERTGSESVHAAHQQIADERLAQGGSLGQFKVAERLARVAEVTVGESKRIVSGPVLRRELDSLREVLEAAVLPYAATDRPSPYTAWAKSGFSSTSSA